MACLPPFNRQLPSTLDGPGTLARFWNCAGTVSPMHTPTLGTQPRAATGFTTTLSPSPQVRQGPALLLLPSSCSTTYTSKPWAPLRIHGSLPLRQCRSAAPLQEAVCVCMHMYGLADLAPEQSRPSTSSI